MAPLVALGVLVSGSSRYALTPLDARMALALVRVEGGRSLDESRAVLGSALRRFALHRAWSSFADFVRAYEGGTPKPGSRRALIYEDPYRAANPKLAAMVDLVLVGGEPLAGKDAEHWAAPSMFPALDATNAQRFASTAVAAVRARNADWRYVDVPGTVPPRSNVFVSTWLSRASGLGVRIDAPR